MSSEDFELVDTGLKRDSAGRRLESQAERERLLSAYDASGLTQRAFAEREGIGYNTFAWWLKQRRRRLRPKQSSPVTDSIVKPITFKECEVRLPKTEALVEVELVDGTLVRGSTVSVLADLVKLLRC